MISLRRDDMIDFYFRFYIDLKPTAILMRKGQSTRWEVVTIMPDGNRVQLLSGHSKRRLVSTVKLIIKATLATQNKDQTNGSET